MRKTTRGRCGKVGNVRVSTRGKDRTHAPRPTALVRTAVEALATPPDYPADAEAAYAVHADTFPTLERLADGQVSLDELATAALEEPLARRRDGHTHPVPGSRFWSVEPDPTSPAGWANRTFGAVLTDTPPLAIAESFAGPMQAYKRAVLGRRAKT